MCLLKKMTIYLLIFGLLLSYTEALKIPKTQAIIDAEADLQKAIKDQQRTKKLVFELNAHIDRLGKRIRTGKTLRTVLRNKSMISPFSKLREQIMTSQLQKIKPTGL